MNNSESAFVISRGPLHILSTSSATPSQSQLSERSESESGRLEVDTVRDGGPEVSLEDNPLGSIEPELKCGVCMELFCKPAFFPCGHSICRLCHLNVDNTTESRTFTAPIFKCPLCRESTVLPWSERPINRALDNVCKEKYPEEYLKLEKRQDTIFINEAKRIAAEKMELPPDLLSLNLSQVAADSRQKLADRLYKDLMILFSRAALQGKSHLSIVEKNIVKKIEICIKPLCKKLFEENNVYKVTCTPDECTVYFSKVSLRWDRDYLNPTYESVDGDTVPSSPPPPPSVGGRRNRRSSALFSSSIPMSEIRALVRDHMNR